MNTDRCVKWYEEALDFFESADDNSLELTFVVSHESESQTGEGFAEFVNSINSEKIKRKLKKIIILDCSYLYRHRIPEFAQYSDITLPSIWFLNNKNCIQKIKCDVEMKFWAEQISGNIFEYWYKQITTDFKGDEDGNGIVQDFKDAIEKEVDIFVSKGKGAYSNCLNFLLEECAHVCAFLKNTIIVYPRPLSPAMDHIIRHYDLNIRCLNYNLSNYARAHQHKFYDRNKINQGTVSLLKTEILNINFFAIDRLGKYIHKNNTFSEIVGNVPYVTDPKAWEVSLKVMDTGERIIIEESDNGKDYLSVKAPLVIDDEIEGVIGLSIDITDRKKAQQLEEQSKLKVVFEQIAHDIRSPLAALSMFTKNCKGLSETEHIALRNISTSIENITGDLLNKYKENKEKESVDPAFSEQYVSIYISLLEIIGSKRYQYKNLDVIFNFSSDPSSNFAFIGGDYSDFCRMTSNLINNSVEALEGKPGIIDISFTAKKQKVEINIKDNGCGMPQEMVDKFMSNIPVGSTKENGHGIGMQQVKSALQEMNGQMLIESSENVGTEITLIFPEVEPPVWVAGQIVLRKGETVVVLDDDQSIHSVWENRLKDYFGDITVKYFTQGNEAIDYINSSKQKNKILLLTDYELRNQSINGIDVIERTNMQKQSILVTSIYTYRIENFSEKAKFLKMVSKLYMNEIPIVMEEDRKTGKADIVFVDDSEAYTQTISDFLDNKGIKAHTYNSPDAFLKNLSQYSKNTKIAIDNELNSNINGVELANLLHKKKYTNLYLLSGRPFREHEVPSYLAVIFKGSEDSIERLL
ncbi:hypothetical protein FACS189472_07230 [Alphaproteobacteria bacterium]|nr:hypothetical protein FACS189472_07230 [Alphaproteobacteria bacterium]